MILEKSEVRSWFLSDSVRPGGAADKSGWKGILVIRLEDEFGH